VLNAAEVFMNSKHAKLLGLIAITLSLLLALPMIEGASLAGGALKQGDKNEYVLKIQNQLKSLGFYKGKLDGVFRSDLTSAVKRFQIANNIETSGTVGIIMRDLLNSGNAVSALEYDKIRPLRKGDRGNAVKKLQEQLRSLKYYSGRVNGIFTDATKRAVANFQKVNSLNINGIADITTRKLLNSGHGKAAPSTQTNDSKRAERVERLIALAKKQLGKPYVFTTTGPNSFDCSGFTQYCYKKIGVKIPRTAHYQGYQKLKRLSKSDLKRGDLLCFNTNAKSSSRVGHVGIYLGNGEFIHCSSTYSKVIITNLSSYGHYSWGLRVF
jgi:cell wall-associated NlpC family hydrolase